MVYNPGEELLRAKQLIFLTVQMILSSLSSPYTDIPKESSGVFTIQTYCWVKVKGAFNSD